MVTMKFEAEKLKDEFVVLPTIMVEVSDKKNCVDICLAWFKGLLTIGISWSRKVVKVQAQ